MDLTNVQLGKYRVVERLGAGGMAEVYKAYQPDLDRYVAVKVIASDLGRDPAFLKQFEREARTLARLEHANILPIYDSGRYKDQPYLVMQYVQGGTLVGRSSKPLPVEEAGRIICQVGDALGYAHASGIVHRDVKPSNVLFDKSGRALLADFGIAQEARSKKQETSGTPAYMAPEQRAGRSVDGRADIYALGVLLYELLTGKRAGEQTLLTRSLSATRIPVPLQEVIVCAAATRPGDRYELAEDFVTAVQEALLKISGERARPPSLTQQAMEAVVIATFTLVGLGLGLYTLNNMIAGRGGWFSWAPLLVAAISCLLNSALFIFRDRARPISWAMLGIVALLVVSPIIAGMPLAIMLDPFYSRGLSGAELLCVLPGVLTSLAAVGLYAYDRLRPRTAAQRSVQRARQVIGQKSAASTARRARFDTRKARDEMLKTLIGILLVAAGARLLAYLAPPPSILGWLAMMLQYGLAVGIAFMTVAFVVWYAFKRITSSSAEAPSEQMPPQALSNVESRYARLGKAREYQARIREAVVQAREGLLRERLQATTQRLDEWVDYIERLTIRLNELERDPVIRRDLSTVPRAVHMLEARLTLDQDTDTGVKGAIRQTLAARQSQLHSLRALERVMTQAELYSEETVATLGTIFSQVLLVDAKDVGGLRAQRLRASIDEEVNALRDLLEAIDQVQEQQQNALG